MRENRPSKLEKSAARITSHIDTTARSAITSRQLGHCGLPISLIIPQEIPNHEKLRLLIRETPRGIWTNWNWGRCSGLQDSSVEVSHTRFFKGPILIEYYRARGPLMAIMCIPWRRSRSNFSICSLSLLTMDVQEMPIVDTPPLLPTHFNFAQETPYDFAQYPLPLLRSVFTTQGRSC